MMTSEIFTFAVNEKTGKVDMEESWIKKNSSIRNDHWDNFVSSVTNWDKDSGYAAEKPKTPSKHLLEKMAFLEKYGNRVADINAVLGYTSHHVRKGITKVKEIAEKAHTKLKQ